MDGKYKGLLFVETPVMEQTGSHILCQFSPVCANLWVLLLLTEPVQLGLFTNTFVIHNSSQRLILFLQIFKAPSLQNRISQGPAILRECSPPSMCHMSHFTCRVSYVTCPMSGVTCHVSVIFCWRVYPVQFFLFLPNLYLSLLFQFKMFF